MVKTAARQAVNLPSGNVPNEKSEKERENTKFWRATRANTNKEEEGKRVFNSRIVGTKLQKGCFARRAERAFF